MPDALASALAAIDTWGGRQAAAAVLIGRGESQVEIVAHGASAQVRPWASVSKLVTAWAVLAAVHRDLVGLDDPAGPPGATIRHLLAHASGLGFEGAQPLSRPERTRIYSNAGYDLLGAVVAERAGRPFEAWLTSAILGPIGMSETRLDGRPSEGIAGPLHDLAAFGRELLRPSIIGLDLAAEAVRPAFPGLAGMLPGVGRYDDLAWGLGPELRNGKMAHWMGTENSPSTFGHFGRSGGFLWVDPDLDVALACLSDRDFGSWALAAWPSMSDAVVVALRQRRGAAGHPPGPPTR